MLLKGFALNISHVQKSILQCAAVCPIHFCALENDNTAWWW